jgi:1,4-alpha-glucan branching enzyme
MLSGVTTIEVQQIVGSNCGDPHVTLGMHEIKVKNRNALSVRAFVPQAKRMAAFDPENPEERWELEKIHEEGFFDSVIKERKKWFRYKLEMEDYEGHVWEAYDPYSFRPVISDVDRYLFGNGTHYEIYEKLGAHVMTVDGIAGTLFAVWAPSAKRVSVVGDFNSWDGRRGQMRQLERSGIWELFVPGVGEGERYKYEVKTFSDQLNHKSDPYGSFAEPRPSTNSVVFDINKYTWGDAKWRARDVTLDAPINIYEMHMGSWKKEEGGGFLTYRAMADQIVPYLKEMGYTHIELLPVMEHPYDGSWGYQVTGYYAPTSRYGTPADFMYFVDKCHKNNIGVFLDWVPAHFPKDAHGLARFDGTALYEHEDPRRGEHPHWGTLIFNYGRSEVKNFLIANALYWIEKFHVDGLRVDAVASMLYLDFGKNDGEWVPNEYGGSHNLEAAEFIKHMNSIISQRNPKAYMIAEESTSWQGVSRPTSENGLGFAMKWNMGWMNDFLSYIEYDPIYRRYHHNKMTFAMVYAYTENFILVLSHDEVVHGKRSMMSKMPGDLWQKCANLRLSYGFMFGHPGKKLLFMGGEFGQFIEWNEKQPLDWFLLEYPHHKQIHDYCKDLNHLYKKERAFWFDDFRGSGFEWLDCDDRDRSVFAFTRKTDDPKETLYFVCNFTPVPILDYRFGVNEPGSYKEIFNSDDVKYGGGGVVNAAPVKADENFCHGREQSVQVAAPPLGMAVFKRKAR